MIWDLAPSYPESPRVFNYQISLAHRLTAWQYPYTLRSALCRNHPGRDDSRFDALGGQRASFVR